MAIDDIRRDKRTPVIIKFRFRSATIDEFIEQYSRDISRGGIFVKHKEPLPARTLVKFEFKLRSDEPIIRGVGRVVWTRDMQQATRDRPPGMGIKFIKLDEESRQLIERVVAGKTTVDVADGPPGGEDVAAPTSGEETLTEAEMRALEAIEAVGPKAPPDLPQEPPKPVFPVSLPPLELPKEPPKPLFAEPPPPKEAEAEPVAEMKPAEKVEPIPPAEMRPEEKVEPAPPPETKPAEKVEPAPPPEMKPAEKVEPAPPAEMKPAEKVEPKKPQPTPEREEKRSAAVLWVLVLIIVFLVAYIFWQHWRPKEEPTRVETDVVAVAHEPPAPQVVPPSMPDVAEPIAPPVAPPPVEPAVTLPPAPPVPEVVPPPLAETQVSVRVVFSRQLADVVQAVKQADGTPLPGPEQDAFRRWLRPLVDGKPPAQVTGFVGGQPLTFAVSPGTDPGEVVLTATTPFVTTAPDTAFELVFWLDEERTRSISLPGGFRPSQLAADPAAEQMGAGAVRRLLHVPLTQLAYATKAPPPPPPPPLPPPPPPPPPTLAAPPVEPPVAPPVVAQPPAPAPPVPPAPPPAVAQPPPAQPEPPAVEPRVAAPEEEARRPPREAPRRPPRVPRPRDPGAEERPQPAPPARDPCEVDPYAPGC